MKWYLKVMRDNYANFNGRARRKEYWMFTLMQISIMILLIILDGVLGLSFEIYGQDLRYGWLYAIGALIHLIPGFAVSVRRLHDVGKSGWFLLIALIPLIGSIWILVLICLDGEKSNNKWGPDSKA